MVPDRILIFGNSGAGKSTAARLLAIELEVAYLDLDTLAWLDTQPPTRRPLRFSAADIERFTDTNEGWVIEGAYADLLTLLLPECSELLFLNPGIETRDDDHSLHSHRWLFDWFAGVKREITAAA
jgi:adenylate kinase family enzyme